jgi:hypothetical protein
MSVNPEAFNNPKQQTNLDEHPGEACRAGAYSKILEETRKGQHTAYCPRRSFANYLCTTNIRSQ